MRYLSQLLNVPVEDLAGERAGKISDIVVSVDQIDHHRPVYPAAFLIEGQEEQPWRVPLASIIWESDGFHLRETLENLTAQTPDQQSEIRLGQDVLDKQVIDILRKKAVRVNDVCFGDDWSLLGIDSSPLGLVRRLAPSWLLGANSRRAPTNLIPWSQIELIGSQRPEEDVKEDTGELPVIQRTTSGHLTELHPADIADIVHQLTPGQGARLIEGLDDEMAADTLEEIDTERQTQILEKLDPRRAAEILNEMEPDETADLLGRLSDEQAQELLDLMTPEESEDVQDLLEYSENSAGGLMTTDFVVLNQDRTVAEALDAIKTTLREQDVRASYVYCVPDEKQDDCNLLGVISLWDLLNAEPGQLLQTLMETDVVTVEPNLDAQAVAEVIAKYNLLAVPVVDADGILQGVVTVDDALDVLLPAQRRRKPTRMY